MLTTNGKPVCPFVLSPSEDLLRLQSKDHTQVPRHGPQPGPRQAIIPERRPRHREPSHVSSFDVAVQVLEEFEGFVSPERLALAARLALGVGPAQQEGSMSVIVADDDTVRDLNKTHRGLDENTDVLAFSFTHEGEYYGEDPAGRGPAPGAAFHLPPGQKRSLGEVVMSYPQAVRQASQAGHPVDRELALLLVHGVLHLLGLDHEEPEEEAAMRQLEVQALERLAAEG